MKRILLATLALSLSLPPSTFAAFSDVPETHLNYEAINYVQVQGIVEGYPDGTYQPDKMIDRYEFTKIIVGAVYSKEEIEACNTSPFPDVPMEWFTPYVCLAEKEGVIDGYPDGTFQGTNKIKLVEAAKIIVNGFKYPVGSDAIWYKPYILKLEELKALPTSLFTIEQVITRGEMAEVIYRLDADVTNKPSTTYANIEKGVFVDADVSTTDPLILMQTYKKCENAKTIPFAYNSILDAHFGAFTWKGKIISKLEKVGLEDIESKVLYFVVEDDSSLAFDHYREVAEMRDNGGPTRYIDGKIYFSLGGFDGDDFVSWAEIDEATKTLILSKYDKNEDVVLNLAQIYVVGGGIYEIGITESCSIEAGNDLTTNNAAVQPISNDPVATNHVFYTSSHHTSKLYYCDTDSAWKSLSPTYLQSYPSEAELLIDYPTKTLNEACK